MPDTFFYSQRMKITHGLFYFTHGQKVQTRISGNEIRDITIYFLFVNNAYLLELKVQDHFASYSENKTLMTKHKLVGFSKLSPFC